MRRRLVALGAALAVVAFGACRDNPNIDGSKVPTVGDPDAGVIPTCAEICPRLEALCGYAPTSDCTDADGGGYCDLNLADDATLSCMGVAPSCQAAWSCVGSEPTPADDAGGDETATDDAGGDETAVDDGATE